MTIQKPATADDFTIDAMPDDENISGGIPFIVVRVHFPPYTGRAEEAIMLPDEADKLADALKEAANEARGSPCEG